VRSISDIPPPSVLRTDFIYIGHHFQLYAVVSNFIFTSIPPLISWKSRPSNPQSRITQHETPTATSQWIITQWILIWTLTLGLYPSLKLSRLQVVLYFNFLVYQTLILVDRRPPRTHTPPRAQLRQKPRLKILSRKMLSWKKYIFAELTSLPQMILHGLRRITSKLSSQAKLNGSTTLRPISSTHPQKLVFRLLRRSLRFQTKMFLPLHFDFASLIPCLHTPIPFYRLDQPSKLIARSLARTKPVGFT
jgi:hypothetical protein